MNLDLQSPLKDYYSLSPNDQYKCERLRQHHRLLTDSLSCAVLSNRVSFAVNLAKDVHRLLRRVTSQRLSFQDLLKYLPFTFISKLRFTTYSFIQVYSKILYAEANLPLSRPSCFAAPYL